MTVYLQNMTGDRSLPILVQCAGDPTPAELNRWRERLLGSGALLFRGTDIKSIQGFEKFCRDFAACELMDYTGGASPRKRLAAEAVYTSTEYPPDLVIPLHNELSYSAAYPQYVFFWCDTPPNAGGETLLADSRRILHDMPSEIVAEFDRKKVCYVRNLVSDEQSIYSWQNAFGIRDKAAAEHCIRAIGANFSWLSNDVLRIEQVGPATNVHPATKERVWFNQADGFYCDDLSSTDMPRLESLFGDGSPIPEQTISEIRAVTDRQTIFHRWLRDDVLALDNILTAHGRAAFRGDRRIVAAMA